MDTFVRKIGWERLDGSTVEESQIREAESGIGLTGHVKGILDGQRFACEYAIQCSAAWVTESLRVDVNDGHGRRVLLLRRGDDGRWWDGDDELVSFRGISDVDLSVSPMTNSVPIRRLQLDVGASAEVDALWVKFPDLGLERLSQRYTCLADGAYLYESADEQFTMTLDVDRAGIVTRYGDVWRTTHGNG